MPKTKICDRCKGEGHHTATLKDIAGRLPHGMGIFAIVPCDMPGCENGIVDLEKNYKSF